MLHLIGRPVLEAGENHHEVRVGQLLDTRHVVGPGLDFALGVHSEHDGALEAMVLGQDAGEGGQSFLGAVLVIARNEDQVLAFPETLFAFVDERSGGKTAHEGGN